MGVFDIEHKHKCPQCGKDMDYLYGKLLCSECGYRAAYKVNFKDETVSMHKIESKQTVRNIPQKTYATATRPTTENSRSSIGQNAQKNVSVSRPTESYKAPSTKKKNNNAIAVVIILVVLVIIIEVVGSIIQKLNQTIEQKVQEGLNIYQMPDVSVPDFDELEKQAEEMLALFESQEAMAIPESTNSMEESVDDTIESQSEGIMYSSVNTQSSGMIEFTELIFGKAYNEITTDEFAMITYIDLYYDSEYMPIVTYGLKDNSMDYAEYYDMSLMNTNFYETDFSVFPNLGTLYMDFGSIGSLQGLENLCVLGTHLPPNEIKQYVDPSKLISLTLYDLSQATALEGLEEFYNLTSLYMYADSVDNIDILVTLQGLRNLGIYYADMVTDFDALCTLHSLERLSLSSYSLTSLDFVSYMPNLESLTIRDCYYSETPEWDYLVFANSLKRLTLDNCYVPYSAEKFLAISQLEELTMTDCMTGFDMENLSYNTNLQELDITGTSFLALENGVWDYDAEIISLTEHMDEVLMYYPNVIDVWY